MAAIALPARERFSLRLSRRSSTLPLIPPRVTPVLDPIRCYILRTTRDEFYPTNSPITRRATTPRCVLPFCFLPLSCPMTLTIDLRYPRSVCVCVCVFYSTQCRYVYYRNVAQIKRFYHIVTLASISFDYSNCALFSPFSLSFPYLFPTLSGAR